MGYFYWDTETGLIQPGLLAPPLVCVAYAHDDSDPFLDNAMDGLNMVEEALDDPDTVLVAANFPFDAAVASAARPSLIPKFFAAYKAGRVRCIQVRQKLIDIKAGLLNQVREDGTRGYSQAVLEKHWCGRDRSSEKGEDTWRLRYGELKHLPVNQYPPEAYEYPLRDVRGLRDVFLAQGGGAIPSEQDQVAADWALHLMSCWGIRTEKEAVTVLETRLLEAQKSNRKWLMRAGFYKAKRASVEQVKAGNVEFYEAPKRGTEPRPMVWARDMARIQARVETVYGRLGKAPPQTDGGKIATDKDTLNESGSRLLSLLADGGGVDKILTTYIPALKQGTEVPVNVRFNVLVNSGRTSSYGDRDYGGFNIQNLPTGRRVGGVRDCFIPRPGFFFVSVDYDTLELRALAQQCLEWFGHSKMADAIRAGQDLHLAMAANILSVDYASALARYKDKDPVIKNTRDAAKCFHPDTEVLTRTGWKKITDVTMEDEIASAEPTQGGQAAISWQKPTRLTSRKADSLVHLRSEGIDLKVTADHRMLGFRTTGTPYDTTPEELNKARFWINAGQYVGGGRVVDHRLLKLAVATQADGSVTDSGTVRFGFVKQRKADRLLSMLSEGEFRTRTTPHVPKNCSGPVTTVTLSTELSANVLALLDNKFMPWWWTELAPELRTLVLDEAEYWDGRRGGNSKAYSFSSSDRQNIDVLQAIAVLSDRKTREVLAFSGDGARRPNWRLTVRRGRTSRGGSTSATHIPYTGDVYCLSVPSSYIVVRSGGVPVVVGQCGNFGLPGGLGAKSFMDFARKTYGVILTETQAQRLKAQWLETWPEMRLYFDRINQLVGLGEATLVGPDGFARGGVGYCDGCNHFFQNRAARGAKAACFDVSYECYVNEDSPLFGSRPVAFIHDEILAEVPSDVAHEAAAHMARTMCLAMGKVIPDIPITASPALMDRWYKNADAVMLDGRLVPWKPKAA